MASKSAMIESDDKSIIQMDECLAEIASIRREMKKADAEIRRLETSTRRKLTDIRANLHVKKAA